MTQAPIEGVSFAQTFNQTDAATRHHTQYYEMFGHRAIYHDGWRAVCPWPGPNFTEAAKKGRNYGSPIDATVLADIEANDWELYDLTTDYAETKNLAAENRDKVIEMVGRWWAEAGKYNVMPLDGSMLQRMNVERPTIAKPRDRFIYYPGGSPVPFSRGTPGVQPGVQHHSRRPDPRGGRRGCFDRPRWPGRWLLLLHQGQPTALRLQLPRTRLLQGLLQCGRTDR